MYWQDRAESKCKYILLSNGGKTTENIGENEKTPVLSEEQDYHKTERKASYSVTLNCIYI